MIRIRAVEEFRGPYHSQEKSELITVSLVVESRQVGAASIGGGVLIEMGAAVVVVAGSTGVGAALLSLVLVVVDCGWPSILANSPVNPVRNSLDGPPVACGSACAMMDSICGTI